MELEECMGMHELLTKDEIELIMHVWGHEIVISIFGMKFHAEKKKDKWKQSYFQLENQVFPRLKMQQGHPWLTPFTSQVTWGQPMGDPLGRAPGLKFWMGDGRGGEKKGFCLWKQVSHCKHKNHALPPQGPLWWFKSLSHTCKHEIKSFEHQASWWRVLFSFLVLFIPCWFLSLPVCDTFRHLLTCIFYLLTMFLSLVSVL